MFYSTLCWRSILIIIFPWCCTGIFLFSNPSFTGPLTVLYVSSCRLCFMSFIIWFSSSWFALHSCYLIFTSGLVDVVSFFFFFSTLSYIAHCPISPSLPPTFIFGCQHSLCSHPATVWVSLPLRCLVTFFCCLLCVVTQILLSLNVMFVSECCPFCVYNCESQLTSTRIKTGEKCCLFGCCLYWELLWRLTGRTKSCKIKNERAEIILKIG